MAETLLKPTIVDYGLGNLRGLGRAFLEIGANSNITNDRRIILNSECIVLPGVGSFNSAMKRVKELKLDLILQEAADKNVPIFGICLGMQLLFSFGTEGSRCEGLGLIKGSVNRLPAQTGNGPKINSLNTGWSCIEAAGASFRQGPFLNLTLAEDERPYMYFNHSYYVDPYDKSIVDSESLHGNFRFCSSVTAGCITGVQFHPEKSGKLGLSLLKSWARGAQVPQNFVRQSA